MALFFVRAARAIVYKKNQKAQKLATIDNL
jgi:hypothetical protein